MQNINRVMISGNLTRDPELRRTQAGMGVLTIGVAVNDRRKNGNGEWEDYANFVDVVFFGTRAESLANYLHKGSKVAIEGKLNWQSWEKDGQRRSKLQVYGEQIEFMDTKQSNQQPTNNYTPQQQTPPQNAPQSGYQEYQQPSYNAQSVYDEDIPF